MPPAVIHAIFMQILLPELSRWLARRKQDEAFPTTEELLAQLNANAAAFITAGEAFLRSKGAIG